MVGSHSRRLKSFSDSPERCQVFLETTGFLKPSAGGSWSLTTRLRVTSTPFGATSARPLSPLRASRNTKLPRATVSESEGLGELSCGHPANGMDHYGLQVSRCSRMPWLAYLSTSGSFSQCCSVFSLPQSSWLLSASRADSLQSIRHATSAEFCARAPSSRCKEEGCVTRSRRRRHLSPRPCGCLLGDDLVQQLAQLQVLKHGLANGELWAHQFRQMCLLVQGPAQPMEI